MSPLLFRRLTDEQLGRRLASGEAAAFDELYRRYSHRLAAYAAQLLGDGAAGDDVAQTTLLKAYGTLRDGRVPAQLKPWLYRVAHNAAIDLVRRPRELPAASLPDRPAAAAPGAGALVAALASLPDRQRSVYVLRELHGLRIDETAAELGLSVAQVEQSLFAARNRLAEHLVFGDRLDCVAVQRLSAGPLELDERRALKTHLRSCAACRSSLGARGRVLASLPLSALEWLRALGGLGAPAAAKIGAVVATAGVATAVPVAAERTNPPHHLPAVTTIAVVRHATHHVRAAAGASVTVRATPVTIAERPVTQATAAAPRRDDGRPRSERAEPEHSFRVTEPAVTTRREDDAPPAPPASSPAPTEPTEPTEGTTTAVAAEPAVVDGGSGSATASHDGDGGSSGRSSGSGDSGTDGGRSGGSDELSSGR